MRCPLCDNAETRVLDTRPTDDAAAMRRRRVCDRCTGRFTTYERYEQEQLSVVKRDGRVEAFEPRKIRNGIEKACSKRPASAEMITSITLRVEAAVRARGGRRVSCSEIGRLVMEALKETDDVAYMRFASVYQDFQSVDHFVDAAEELADEPAK